MSSGSSAYRPDSNRMAWASTSTRSISWWIARILLIFRGVMDRETREAMRCALLQVDLPFRSSPAGRPHHKHAAGAGNGVLLLAALRHDLQDLGSDFLIVVSGLVGDLGKGSRVDVQGGDVHRGSLRHLVHIVIDTVGRWVRTPLGSMTQEPYRLPFSWVHLPLEGS